MKKAILAILIVTLSGGGVALAADKWWDINGATAGAGGATPTGNWDTATSNWTTDSTGSSAGTTWTSGDAAIFSAGTNATGLFTVTTTAAQTASSITVEEGTVRHAGTSTNKLTTSGLTINSGATFGVNVASSFTPTAGSVATLNGGTIENYNPSTGGSFLTVSTSNTNMKITLGTGGGHVSANGGAGIISIYTGLIDGTGPLSIDGTGVFRLTTTTATYSGATIINGTLQLSTTGNVLPSGTALTINSGGKLDYQTSGSQTVASLDGTGNLAGTSAAVLTIAGTASTTFGGVWSGSGRINVNKSGGAGTLTLTGVNTATGRFTLTNGTVTVDPGAALGGSALDLEVNGGVLNLNNAAQSIEGLAGIGGTINLASGHMLTVDPIASATPINNIYSGTIAGDGGITKVNVISGATVRTQTLSGNNTYNGNTFVKGGKLSVQHANALGSTTGYTEVNQVGAVAAELIFTTSAGSVTTSEPLRISGNGAATDEGAIAVTAGATPTISGAVTLIGDATLTVSGSSSVLYNNANSITSLANQSLTLAGGSGTSPLGIGTISGAIALGTGSLTKNQGGTWVLGGTNTYSGVTNINAGTLSVSSINNNLGTNTTVNIGSTTTGGNLTYTGSGESTSKIINLAGTTGGAFLVQSGTGNLQFTSDLTATGVGAKTLTLQGSTAGTGEITGKIVDGSGTISVAKSGSGTWTLSGNNSYTGSTTIGAGTLVASDVKNTGTNSNLGAGASIAFGATTSTGTLKYTGTGDATNRVVDLAGTTGGGTIDQSGTGNLKITSNLTATGAGSKTLTLQGSTAGTGEIAGAIVDNSGTNKTSLAKSGSGTWTLSGASTYTGTTTINAGTLAVNGSITGTGAVTVKDGGTLAGTGSLAGAVTVQGGATGGTLSPGNSPGMITLGSLTFDSGSSLKWQIDTTYPVSLTTGADLVVDNGALSIASGAKLVLEDIGAPQNVVPGPATSKFTLIAYSSWDGGLFNVNGNPVGDGGTVQIGINQYTLDYNDTTGGTNFVDYSAGGANGFVTLTAIPEASSVILGSLVCVVVGLTAAGKKLLRRRAAA